MPGCIDHVERVSLAVFRPGHADGLTLNRDTSLAFDIHSIEILGAHVSGFDNSRQLQHPVRQRRLSVINVRNDRKIAQAPDIGRGRLDIAVRVRRHVR